MKKETALKGVGGKGRVCEVKRGRLGYRTRISFYWSLNAGRGSELPAGKGGGIASSC